MDSFSSEIIQNKSKIIVNYPVKQAKTIQKQLFAIALKRSEGMNAILKRLERVNSAIPEFCTSHWLLRIPLALLFIQMGLMKLPFMGQQAFPFAVLFGGIVALLPVYAHEILHVGPEGLGVLRSAIAIGAFLMGLYLGYGLLGICGRNVDGCPEAGIGRDPVLQGPLVKCPAVGCSVIRIRVARSPIGPTSQNGQIDTVRIKMLPSSYLRLE